jgi:hypothetical protein
VAAKAYKNPVRYFYNIDIITLDVSTQLKWNYVATYFYRVHIIVLAKEA